MALSAEMKEEVRAVVSEVLNKVLDDVLHKGIYTETESWDYAFETAIRCLGYKSSNVSEKAEYSERAKIAELLTQGKLVDAVKLHREATQVGIKEAVDYVKSFPEYVKVFSRARRT